MPQYIKTMLGSLSLTWLKTHRGRVTHICVSTQTIIGSDNGLSPGRRQAIIWTSAAILSIGPLGANFNEIVIEIGYIFIQENAFKNVVRKMAAILSRPPWVYFLASAALDGGSVPVGTRGFFYSFGLTVISACIGNHMFRKVWDEIIYPFPNYNGATVEVGEWICNFISYFIMDVITQPCWDQS